MGYFIDFFFFVAFVACTKAYAKRHKNKLLSVYFIFHASASCFDYPASLNRCVEGLKIYTLKQLSERTRNVVLRSDLLSIFQAA